MIIDPEYHYETVNVEAQHDNPELAAVVDAPPHRAAQAPPAFGRGTIELLPPENHRVLAFLRRDRSREPRTAAAGARRREPVAATRSTSSSTSPSSAGSGPIELFGQTSFPPIGELPYLLTLGPHAFYWLALEPAPRRAAATAEQPVLPSLDGTGRVGLAVRARPPRTRFDAVLPRLLRSRRWFGAKGRRVTSGAVGDVAEIPLPFLWSADEELPPPRPAHSRSSTSSTSTASPRRYVLPVAFVPGAAGERARRRPPGRRARARRAGDGRAGRARRRALAARLRPRARCRRSRRRRRIRHRAAARWPAYPARARPRALTEAVAADLPVSVLRGEQTNTSIVVRRPLHAEDAAPPRAGREPGGRDRALPDRRAAFEHSPDAPARSSTARAASASTARRSACCTSSSRTRATRGPHVRRALAPLLRGRAVAAARRRSAPSGRHAACACSTSSTAKCPTRVRALIGGILRAGRAARPAHGELHVALASRRRPGLRTRSRSTRSTCARTTSRCATPPGRRCAPAPRRRHAARVERGRRARSCSRTPTRCSTASTRDRARASAASASASTATTTSARCCTPAATSSSSTSRASPPARSASAGSSARRSATSPACCARSTTRPTPRSPRSAARGTVRSEERARELLAGRAAQWVALGVGGVPARLPATGDGRPRPAPRRPRAPPDPARRLPAREGRLRAALRARPTDPTGSASRSRGSPRCSRDRPRVGTRSPSAS